MRKLVAAAVGLTKGILPGLLFEPVGVVSFLLSDRAVEFRFLPVVLGLGGAVAAPVPDDWARSMVN